MVRTAAAMILAAGAAQAAPQVAADVAPVHSLVARVMQGVGEPALILPPGASPHGHAMRPSEAAALERADVVFWIGESLTPWLARSLGALAGDATVVELAEAEGLVRLAPREDARFEAHDHDHAAEAHDHDHGHAADAHDDHDHGHAEQAHGHDHGDDHEHAALDPHLWLDPANAAAMLDAIAAALSQADPANAPAYAANAAAGRAEMTALIAEISARLDPARGRGFVVFHDAYQYFETRFDMPAAGALSLSDARAPGAARVAEVREAIEAADVACVFAEPQFAPSLVATLIEGTGARSGVLDPIGAALTPGPELYPALLRGMADAMADCLGPAS